MALFHGWTPAYEKGRKGGKEAIESKTVAPASGGKGKANGKSNPAGSRAAKR